MLYSLVAVERMHIITVQSFVAMVSVIVGILEDCVVKIPSYMFLPRLNMPVVAGSLDMIMTRRYCMG
jgi:hypothetical protein